MEIIQCHVNHKDDDGSFLDTLTYESVQEHTMTITKNPTKNPALHLNAQSFIDSDMFACYTWQKWRALYSSSW